LKAVVCSKIAIGFFIGPVWLKEPKGSHRKEGSRKMSKYSMVCAGIDVGKHKLDVACGGRSERLQVDNTADGHRKLSAWLGRQRVKRVGVEATGGYEQAMVVQLRHAGFEVIVFQPAQVRAYARFHLQLAKNDKIDAALIAACTSDTKKVFAPPDPRLAPWAQRLSFIDQITEDIVRLKTRCESCRDERIQRYWREDIARLKKLQKSELKALVAEIRQHRDLAERLDLIASVDGIGLPTAVVILVRMPEIGRISREQVAALAGLAPFDADSGQQHGARHIKGGRARLRRSLYAAALPAALRWNTRLIPLYRRLMAAGKEHKAALIACARKLLIYANTVVERGTPWVREQASLRP
jgi:transposase